MLSAQGTVVESKKVSLGAGQVEAWLVSEGSKDLLGSVSSGVSTRKLWSEGAEPESHAGS